MMDNKSFLRKFKGRTEIIGKSGLLGIMDNLHINIIGNKPKSEKYISVKLKDKKFLDNDYSHVASIVKEEFNKNINFIPRLKIINNNSNSNFKNINNEKFKKNPLKLFQIIEKDNNKEKEIFYEGNTFTKKYNNKNMKFPLIISKNKSENKNILSNDNEFNTLKSYERKSNLELKKTLKLKKISSSENINIRKKNINTFQEKNLNNPNSQIFNIKKNNIFSTNNIFNHNNTKNDIINIKKSYANILNKIQNDFTILDSIKNRINKLQRNNSYLENENNLGKINDYYNDENKSFNDIKNNTINTNNNLINARKNILENKKNNLKNINNPKNSEKYFKEQMKIKECSLNNLTKEINNKLPTINEKGDDKNILNTNNINIIDNSKENDNFLEKLMKQRLNYQNKIPDNSIFKLNQDLK